MAIRDVNYVGRDLSTRAVGRQLTRMGNIMRTLTIIKMPEM